MDVESRFTVLHPAAVGCGHLGPRALVEGLLGGGHGGIDIGGLGVGHAEDLLLRAGVHHAQGAAGKGVDKLAADVLAQLSGRVDLLIDGGLTPGGVPSTVVDCTGADPRVLREGPVSEEAVRLAWHAAA